MHALKQWLIVRREHVLIKYVPNSGVHLITRVYGIAVDSDQHISLPHEYELDIPVPRSSED